MSILLVLRRFGCFARRGAGGARAAAVARAQMSLSCICLLYLPQNMLARVMRLYELYVLSVFCL